MRKVLAQSRFRFTLQKLGGVAAVFTTLMFGFNFFMTDIRFDFTTPLMIFVWSPLLFPLSLGFLVWFIRKTPRIEVDDLGLHVVGSFGSVIYPWGFYSSYDYHSISNGVVPGAFIQAQSLSTALTGSAGLPRVAKVYLQGLGDFGDQRQIADEINTHRKEVISSQDIEEVRVKAKLKTSFLFKKKLWGILRVTSSVFLILIYVFVAILYVASSEPQLYEKLVGAPRKPVISERAWMYNYKSDEWHLKIMLDKEYNFCRYSNEKISEYKKELNTNCECESNYIFWSEHILELSTLYYGTKDQFIPNRLFDILNERRNTASGICGEMDKLSNDPQNSQNESQGNVSRFLPE